jgi:hypothetical protein
MSLSAGFDYNVDFITSKVKTPGIHGSWFYASDDRKVGYLRFHAFLPAKYSHADPAYVMNNYTDPMQITVTGTTKVSAIGLSAGGRYYSFTSSPEDGGLYGLVNVGVLTGKEVVEFDPYDKDNYSTVQERGGRFLEFYGGLGGGYDFKINDNMFINIEVPVQLGLRAFDVEEIVPFQLFTSPGIGFRYYFEDY